MPDRSHHYPPEKPDLKRWGGPGSSHQDATEPPPEWEDPRPDGSPTNPPTSTVSGGGGERDLKHTHDDDFRSSKQSKGGPSGRDPYAKT